VSLAVNVLAAMINASSGQKPILSMTATGSFGSRKKHLRTSGTAKLDEA